MDCSSYIWKCDSPLSATDLSASAFNRRLPQCTWTLRREENFFLVQVSSPVVGFTDLSNLQLSLNAQHMIVQKNIKLLILCTNIPEIPSYLNITSLLSPLPYGYSDVNILPI
jgi:hypothetical protein